MMVWARGRVAYEVFQGVNFARGFPLPMGFSERIVTNMSASADKLGH